jgi:hypothetical protein
VAAPLSPHGQGAGHCAEGLEQQRFVVPVAVGQQLGFLWVQLADWGRWALRSRSSVAVHIAQEQGHCERRAWVLGEQLVHRV